jgi:hypothetical protein
MIFNMAPWLKRWRFRLIFVVILMAKLPRPVGQVRADVNLLLSDQLEHVFLDLVSHLVTKNKSGAACF